MIVARLGASANDACLFLRRELGRLWPQYRDEIAFVDADLRGGNPSFSRMSSGGDPPLESVSGITSKLFDANNNHFSSYHKLLIYYVLNTTDFQSADDFQTWLSAANALKAATKSSDSAMEMLILLLNEDNDHMETGAKVREKRLSRFAPFIKHAHGLIFLIDPEQLDAVKKGVDNDRDLVEPAMVLDESYNLITESQTSYEKCSTPVAICISKIDEIQWLFDSFDTELWNLLIQDIESVPDANGYALPVFNAHQYNPIFEKLLAFFKSTSARRKTRMLTRASW